MILNARFTSRQTQLFQNQSDKCMHLHPHLNLGFVWQVNGLSVCFIIHLHLSLYCLSNHTNSLVKLDFENIILTILKNVENTQETPIWSQVLLLLTRNLFRTFLTLRHCLQRKLTMISNNPSVFSYWYFPPNSTRDMVNAEKNQFVLRRMKEPLIIS